MAHLRRANRPLKQEDPAKNRQSFFTHESPVSIQRKREASFFQPKLTVGEPGDQYEQEADAVANLVVSNNQMNGNAIQKKKISSIQRLSTSKEDESMSTDEERMRRDKEIQRKEIQREELPKEEEEKLGTGSVQRSQDTGSSAVSPRVSSRIEQSRGSGKAMSAKTLGAMQSSFGQDFSNVNIHTDGESVALNRELGAQAFTHGSDIYFNSGKYDPESTNGKKLLAHELTHVVQQTSSDPENMNKSAKS